ncbi:43 kDa receptor-associated protein of the synapse homolog [Danaus plexippus]|uniref:43 kDa receptor-associated protein of the synapse homolog n=1 Tax=Danaus plexippus TaxID=13037 RepID=UPI002AB3225D|nr:43 kDa receptor-associated protein of the synapse homolog [Danaus plexippus]XP_061381631.1 43 kDa receptor-associated protein of the synapse homolog [Danaus plexippus]XP_061381632.1 43 kDa receptor-associated protein of the synapse homolog [Danaus plexippus]
MSWDSIESRDFLGGVPAHQLSATRLLSSPDPSRHHIEDPPELYPFSEEYANENRNGAIRWGSRFGPAHRPSGVLECFRVCRSRLDQYFARRKIERGLRLYMQNEQRQAVKVWLSALRGVRHRTDKFALLGHLYKAYMDFGKYRESLEFANRQLGISEELDSAPMRAEAYLNLAMAHQNLGGLDRALSYARHALYNDCGGGSTAGFVHLTVAVVSMELGAVSKAMDGFMKALGVAQAQDNDVLTLQVYVGLSELWRRLRDLERSFGCASRACDVGRGHNSLNLNTRHHRNALLQMAAALRAKGELGDAHDYVNEALRLASVAGDQGCYARAMRLAGDVYRRKSDLGKALRHYEVAMGAGQSLGDRLAQMEAMDGAARCLDELRLQGRICNCRPLEFNTRLLEVATSVGSKMLVRRVRLRLADIYTALGDNNAAARQKRAASAWAAPTCGRCREPLAERPEPLVSLPCTHFVHLACMPESWSRRSNRGSGECAECASPRARAPPPAPPAPRSLPSQVDFPFGTPPTLRDSDINSVLSDHSSQQATSSV